MQSLQLYIRLYYFVAYSRVPKNGAPGHYLDGTISYCKDDQGKKVVSTTSSHQDFSSNVKHTFMFRLHRL